MLIHTPVAKAGNVIFNSMAETLNWEVIKNHEVRTE